MTGSADPLSRRQAFALAAALALTVVTGGAAMTGLRHAGHAARPAPIVQLAQPTAPAPALAPPAAEESD
jgi:hypothetical protein